MTVITKWVAEPLAADVQSTLDRLATSDAIDHIAVMPDVHMGRDVCIGVVVGSPSRLYPQAVGGDIGCGMATLGLRADAERIDNEVAAARLLTILRKAVPSNRHSASTVRATLWDYGFHSSSVT